MKPRKKAPAPMVAPVRPLLRVAQVAELLGMSIQAIYKWKDQGLLPYMVIGRRTIRFDPDMVEAYRRGEDVSTWAPAPDNVVALRSSDG